MMRLVEEETEVGEDNPELLPAVGVLELSQQVAAQLVAERLDVIGSAHAGVAMPANVHSGVGTLLVAATAARFYRRRCVVVGRLH